MKIQTLICLRCGHGRDRARPWIPRRAARPKRCPKCGSPYWHTPRGVLPPGRRPRRAAG
ncbi:MAG: hypothetical protein L6R00_06440 [Phycisphaerae bacterium]|nr:hypothetical protein [Phycisphaerae bacterium]